MYRGNFRAWVVLLKFSPVTCRGVGYSHFPLGRRWEVFSFVEMCRNMVVNSKSVVFVELQPALPNIGSFLISPSYGIILLATSLQKLRYKTSVLVEGITEINIQELEKFDFVCFSLQSAAANKTYQMADDLRKKGKIIIFGGTHATYFPEDCLEHCDYVVRREGDDVLPALLSCLENKGDLSQMRGISYNNNGHIRHNADITPPADLSISADYSLIRDISRWNPLKRLLNGRRVILPVQSSRGCPNNCSFCIVNKMFGGTYRKRPIDTVIAETKSAIRYTNRIQFVDNNFVGSSKLDIEYTTRLLQAIIANNIKIKASAFVTIDVASNHDLLGLMKKAGIKLLMIGFESINPKTLDGYHKHQEIDKIVQPIRTIKEYGFDISATFMAGSDEDDYDSIIQTAQFATKWNLDQLHYFMLTVYPEMRDLVPPKRVFVRNWDFFHGHYATFFPRNICPSKLHEAVFKANRIFYSLKRIMKSLFAFKFNFAGKLVMLRILYQIIGQSIKHKHIPFLRELERELYTEGKLNEELLRRRRITKIKYWEENYYES